MRITIQRRGKLDPQKFRRRNEHFFRPPELQLGDTDSWNAHLQLVNQTLDQFGTLEKAESHVLMNIQGE